MYCEKSISYGIIMPLLSHTTYYTAMCNERAGSRGRREHRTYGAREDATLWSRADARESDCEWRRRNTVKKDGKTRSSTRNRQVTGNRGSGMESGGRQAGKNAPPQIIPNISRGTHATAMGYRLPHLRRQTTFYLYFTLYLHSNL